MHKFFVAAIAILMPLTAQAITFEKIPGGQADTGYVEIHGVAAGDFNAAHWQANTLHLVPDARRPLIAPRHSGVFRNIYAPSAVQTNDGWRVFYGAWDGVDTGNDRIYSVTTTNFIDFDNHRTVIEHGDFIHVCNVNAFKNSNDTWEMMCTALMKDPQLNRPVYFTSPDGITWNGRAEPAPANASDLITIEGYPGFAESDINGVNVLMRDGADLHLYFNDFKQFGSVYHALWREDKTFAYQQAVLEVGAMVNDVKRFDADGKPWYLMALHANRQQLWYSLANTPLAFQKEQPLFERLGQEDNYIVAVGFVRKDNRLLGFLYGAGAVPELNRNRIFGVWLQHRVVFVRLDGQRFEAETAMGPDRCLIRLPQGARMRGHFEVYAEDGLSLLGQSETLTLRDQQVMAIKK